MSYEVVKFIHVSAMAILVFGFGLMVSVGTSKDKTPCRKAAYILHGLGWLILFISAFGLIYYLQLGKDFPVWAKIKTGIWLILGLLAFWIKKKPQSRLLNGVLIVALVMWAIGLAVFKP